MAVKKFSALSFFVTHGQHHEPHWRPATDVYRTPTGWLVKVELAGVEPAAIEVTTEGRFVRVRGERNDTCQSDGCRQLHMEIEYHKFERQVELPADLTAMLVTSEYQHGMLLVRIDREPTA